MVLFLIKLFLFFLLLMLESVLDCDLVALRTLRLLTYPEVALFIAQPKLLLAALQVAVFASRIFLFHKWRHVSNIFSGFMTVLSTTC